MKRIFCFAFAASLAASLGCADGGTAPNPQGTGGVTTTGGTTSGAGGTVDIGGTVSDSGGSQNSGPGGQGGAAGGDTAQGGSISTGGNSEPGGSSATGGNSEPGGSSATGGNSEHGGSTATGGATSTAGAKTSGGTTSTGGAKTSGGTTSAGGSTSAGGATSTGPCAVLPVTPNASPQAKNLLCYLYQQYGNHVLSGQQEANWNANPTNISWYNSNGMKSPAILGSDFMYTNGVSCSSVTPSTTRAIAYWNAGGLIMFRYHMGLPGAGLTCKDDCYKDAPNCAEPSGGAPSAAFFTNVVTAGTPENTSLNAKLDYVAVQIKAMEDANVPIILALFHETQKNSWFWWGMTSSGASFIKLYTYAFDYLTKTKGLTNIIWLMPFSGQPSSDFFPGPTIVDFSGGDTYGSDQPFKSLYSSCKSFMGNTMPIALHETGLIPTPSAMFPTSAPWILFNIWAGFETSNNTVANIKSVYSDSHTITRDLVPNLK